jgi:hypothetical protein
MNLRIFANLHNKTIMLSEMVIGQNSKHKESNNNKLIILSN